MQRAVIAMLLVGCATAKPVVVTGPVAPPERTAPPGPLAESTWTSPRR